MARNQRQQRVGDQIQRELTDLLRRELRDPRVGLVTLTGVEVSADRSHAVVYYTCLDPAQVQPAGEGLARAAGFLRSQLARRITTYTVPELRFRYDESIARGARLSKLIDELPRPDLSEPAEPQEPPDPADKDG